MCCFVLSVGVRFPGEFDQNATEAEIRDLCIKDARSLLMEFSSKAEFFTVQRKAPDAVVEKAEGNVSSLNIDFARIGMDAGMLKVGKMDDGGYAVIVGGIVNEDGDLVAVAVSGLEMAQNSLRYNWTREQVDDKLKDIMADIHSACLQYGQEDKHMNYVKGANIAGFVKVADAMLAQGVV